MKKVFLSIALLSAVAFTTQAQTEKGKFIVGGSVGYETEKVKGGKASHEFNIIPSVGYFVSDNIAVGTGIGYATAKGSTPSPIGKIDAFVVAPFGRHYTSLSDNFKFYGQLSVPMAFGTSKETDADLKVGDKTGSSTSIGVEVSPGFAFFPTSKFAIEFGVKGISYNNNKVEDGNGNELSKSDSFSIGTDFFNPKVGVKFLF